MLNQFVTEAMKGEADTSPNYTYILFETIALTLKNLKSGSQLVEIFEGEINPSLNAIIGTCTNELSSYTF